MNLQDECFLYMCGIIGIINSSDAAEEIFLGLQNLQHRGQDGGGIVTAESGAFHHHRGAGLLDIAFPPENFKKLAGSMGIGHTRYATTGKKELSLLQPFVDSQAGLAIGHNGNIVNYHAMRESIRQSHPDALASGSDSELILWLLGQHWQHTDRNPAGLLESIQYAASQLVGSYSVVGLAEGVGLFAFRDPNGLRPLVVGRREDEGKVAFAFSSESAALEFIGFTPLFNVEAGEAVIVTLAGELLRHRYDVANIRHCMFEWVYFARVESDIDNLSVYQARFNLGVQLAYQVKQLGLMPDIVVPVPETSRIAAIALAETLQVPFREVLIKNRYVNRTFILESQSARLEAIRRKLYPVSSELKGKRVLVVDDSIVRGNTAIKIIELVRRSGAEEIYLASTCPPIQSPCYYGIDFPDKAELLAGKHTAEDLPQVLGVDKLVYQTMEGLESALQTDKLCKACLTGNYPTDVSYGESFSKQRAQEREVAAP